MPNKIVCSDLLCGLIWIFRGICNTLAGMLETWKPGIPENKAWNPKTRNDFFSDDKRS